MAGKLVQVATNTVTSSVSSVTLTGIDSDDVYMVSINNLFTDSGTALIGRFTESGTENSSSNYDMASRRLLTNTSYGNMPLTNRTDFYSEYFLGSVLNTTAPMNAIFYIYSAYNSSKNTYITWEQSGVYSGGGILLGNQGGGVMTVQSQVDGFKWATNTGNIAGGTFTLYRVLGE